MVVYLNPHNNPDESLHTFDELRRVEGMNATNDID